MWIGAHVCASHTTACESEDSSLRKSEEWRPALRRLRVKRRAATSARKLLLLGLCGSGLFDGGGYFFEMGDVDGVAGAGDFGGVGFGAGGVPAFEVGVDGAVGAGDEHPAGFAAPSGGGNGSFEIIGEVEDLGAGHGGGLRVGKIGAEIFVKLSGVEIGEAVRSFFDGARFAEVAGETLAIVGFVFSGVGHVRGDVDEGSDVRVIAGFGDDGAAVTVGDENGGAVLEREDAAGGGDVVRESGFGFLHDGYAEAFLGEEIGNGLPAGAVGPSAVDEDDVVDRGGGLSLRCFGANGGRVGGGQED
jgi:hypothetical protein